VRWQIRLACGMRPPPRQLFVLVRTHISTAAPGSHQALRD
jgi:hypothetical protein